MRVSEKYKLRLQNSNVFPVWRDGVMAASLNNTIHIFGGWNANETPILINSHLSSENKGVNWATLPNAPWTARHAVGHAALNNYIYVWGAESSVLPTVQDCWRFNGSNWSLVAANLKPTAFGDRALAAHCVHNGYLYSVGGTVENTVRSADGATWETVGTLPAGMMPLTAAVVSFKGNLYYFGGQNAVGQVDGKVWKSTDDGATWELILTDYDRFGTYYCNAAANSEAIFFLQGANPIDRFGLFASTNGLNWTAIDRFPDSRHATAMCVFQDEIYVLCGHTRNDCLRVKKVSSQYRYYN